MGLTSGAKVGVAQKRLPGLLHCLTLAVMWDIPAIEYVVTWMDTHTELTSQ